MDDDGGAFFNSFVNLVKSRRYEAAYDKLQIMLQSPDCGSALTGRRNVTKMLQDFSARYVKAAANQSVDEKLNLLEFFLACFASTFDTEGQFVIQYEMLMLRDAYKSINPGLCVAEDEWIQFGNECCKCGFFSNAVKAYDAAIRNTQSPQVAAEVGEMRDFALKFARGENAVEVEAMHRKNLPLEVPEKPSTAAAKYVSCIKRRNAERLRMLQMNH